MTGSTASRRTAISVGLLPSISAVGSQWKSAAVGWGMKLGLGWPAAGGLETAGAEARGHELCAATAATTVAAAAAAAWPPRQLQHSSLQSTHLPAAP